MEDGIILRVIAGTARGHKLKTIKGDTTRPTSDRVKESLYNIIAMLVIDAKVLDLYSGTGNLGIEALSRGAHSAVFVDKSRECCEVIKDNLAHTKLESKAEVINGDVNMIIDRLGKEGKTFDIILLDPPYNKNLIEETLKKIVISDIIKNSGVVIAEHDINDKIPEKSGDLKHIRSQRYGDTVLSFYKNNKEQEDNI